MPPVIDKDKCNTCGICVDYCPTDVYRWGEKGGTPIVVYPDECWHCNSCVLDCKVGAIKLRIPLPAMMLYVDAQSLKGD